MDLWIKINLNYLEHIYILMHIHIRFSHQHVVDVDDENKNDPNMMFGAIINLNLPVRENC